MTEPDSEEVKTIRIVVTFDGGRAPRRRTVQLPKNARNIRARVHYELIFGASFEIPVETVRAGLADFFKRTDGEMKTLLGASD